MSVLPKQKMSSLEKLKVDPVSGKLWGESNVDYFIDEVAVSDEQKILDEYRLLEGELNDADYEYVLNPLNTTVDRYKRFGATLRNYDIISPVVNLYTGEFSQRFKNFQVLESNSGEDNDYKEGLNKLITGFYSQQTINDLESIGIQTGQQTTEGEGLEQQIAKFNEDYDDTRVISGQEILEFIYYDKDLDDKYQDAYKDWLVAGRAITYKGIFHNDIDFEVVPPWQYSFPKNLRSNFLEDAPWGVRRQVMAVNQILDRWNGQLTEDQIEWLDRQARDDGFNSSRGHVMLPTAWISNESDYKSHSILNQVSGVQVYHVEWRSFAKVGILTTTDELGQIVEKEVKDTYKLSVEAGDISVEWDWVSEVWEGWRIGESHDGFYIDVQPLAYNRMSLNNKSLQKLSYNGRVNSTVTGKINSIVSAGRPYQLLYNVLHYQLEKTINKNKGSIMVIPQGLMPKGINGWDEEKMMYYADASGMLVIDETTPTAGIAINGIKVLDMSLGKFIKELIEIMQHIKQEYWDLIGMNRQRYGDSKASDGKGVTEQAIARSAIISDELNRKFEKFQEKDYAGLLDLSKLAYIDGKKGKYINSKGTEAILDLNIDDAVNKLNSDFNIHVKNSKTESDKINLAKEYGMSLGQNGETSSMLELIASTNFTKTKQIIAKLEEAKKSREEAAAQADRDSQEAIAQTNQATQAAKDEMTKYKADRDYEKAIDVKELELMDNDKNNNGHPDNTNDNGDDGLARENLNETKRVNNHKMNLDNKKHILDKRDQIRKERDTAAKIKQANKPKTSN